jgi:hypothetical protein
MDKNQMQHMIIHPYSICQAMDLTISNTQLSNVHIVQSTTPKGTQQPEGKNKKGKIKKGGGNNNKNPKSNENDEGAKQEKKKVKFPCNLCSEDHLTHQCPKIKEAQSLLV